MLLKKKVKAGILIYALLISSVFAMLLQFYLGRVVASQKQHQAQILQSQSYLMAQMTASLASKEKGQFVFKEGISEYAIADNVISITVHLDKKKDFSYQFSQPSQVIKDKKV